MHGARTDWQSQPLLAVWRCALKYSPSFIKGACDKDTQDFRLCATDGLDDESSLPAHIRGWRPSSTSEKELRERKMSNRFAPRLAATLGLLGAAILPALAHHSTVMFDKDQEVKLTGTVKQFTYANPHAFIQIVVPQPEGSAVEWRIATEASVALGRAGIERKSLQPGEQVTVRAHPLKGGQPGGWLIDVTKADGTVLDPDDDN
jgi:Family of unknown function (DUF6152)